MEQVKEKNPEDFWKTKEHDVKVFVTWRIIQPYEAFYTSFKAV